VALAALGVVFGDIGTSPLYAFETVFSLDASSRRRSPWCLRSRASRSSRPASPVVPLALVVLAWLFLLHRRGTDRVGRLFGPVMVVSFAALAAVRWPSTRPSLGHRDDYHPDLPAVLRRAARDGAERAIDVDGASWFLACIMIAVGDDPRMPRWEKRLFIALAQNAASAADYFGLPSERTVVMSSRVCV